MPELRREIGFVPQESLLFSYTIGTNIAYGAPAMDTVEWAAEAAQLTDTVRSSPGGTKPCSVSAVSISRAGKNSGRTRASAIRDADLIIVLNKGQVVEKGRHDELMAAEGRYWGLLRHQQLVESIDGARDASLAGHGIVNE